MGERGPKSRPNHLKALMGVDERYVNRDEPIPTEGAIVPPVDLPDDAQAVWDRLAPDLIAKKVLTSWDVDAFASYCRWAALYNRAAREVENEEVTVPGSHGGTVLNPAIRAMDTADKGMRAVGSRFGLTPGDRAELKVDHGSGSRSGAERLLS